MESKNIKNLEKYFVLSYTLCIPYLLFIYQTCCFHLLGTAALPCFKVNCRSVQLQRERWLTVVLLMHLCQLSCDVCFKVQYSEDMS